MSRGVAGRVRVVGLGTVALSAELAGKAARA
jgi:hypothetical protein